MNYLLDNVICNVDIHAVNFNLHSKCDLASEMWLQLDLATEFRSDLGDSVDWVRKLLANLNPKKSL